MLPLTGNERKFAEDNHNIILDFMHKKRLPIWESDQYTGEDWYGVCSYGYIKAIKYFTKEYGYSFTSFAYKCMENEVKQCYRRQNALKNKNDNIMLSLNYGYEDEKLDLINFIGCEESIEDMAITKITLENAYKKMSERDKEILAYLFIGMKRKEIEEITGVSRANISRIKNVFLEKAGFKKH